MTAKKPQVASEPPEIYYTTEQFARIMRVEPATVRTWRRRGYGPKGWFRSGQRSLIRIDVAHAWMAAKEQAVEVYAA